jgi:aubergine-like protein
VSIFENYFLFNFQTKETEVASTRETDQQIINIKIRRVGEIVPTSPNFIHLFNIVFRRCLKLYGMKQIDRNFYDMKRRINIPEYGLDLINGLATAISSFEGKLLLCAELTHKLLHKTTILEMMTRLYQESKNNTQFREICISRLVGKIVMTKFEPFSFENKNNSFFSFFVLL